MEAEEFTSVLDEARAVAAQAGEVSELLQAHGESVCEDRAGFQAQQLDAVRAEAAVLLGDLAAAEAENEQLRADAAARVALVRAVSERVGSLKQLSLCEASAAVEAARRGQVDRELAEAKQDVAQLQAALDTAITAGQAAVDAHAAASRDDAAKLESLQLDLRHALRSLRDARQAARERESRHLAAVQAAKVATAGPLQAELVAIAQQVHAYEKAALEQLRANEADKGRQQALAAETSLLRSELVQQSEQVAALRSTVAGQASAADTLGAQLEDSKEDLRLALSSVKDTEAQLAKVQAGATDEMSELRSRNTELCSLVNSTIASAEAAAASRHELQVALDEARSDANRAKEQLAKSLEAAAEVAERSAADVAALESLEYLHEVLPSQTQFGPIGDRAMPEPHQRQIGGTGPSGDEAERLRSELSEALVLSESRKAELEAARIESRVAEEKYSQLVASHAAVAEAATPRVRSSDDESDDEAEPTEAGSNKRSRVATRVDDLVSAVTSLREERDRSVRVAASLNRKLSTLMREQRYSAKLIDRLRADGRDSATERSSFDDGPHRDDDGAGSAVSVGSSGISLLSSQETGSSADSSSQRTYHQLESDVARLTCELNRVRQSERSIMASYQELVAGNTTGKSPGAQDNRHPAHCSGVSRVEEGQEDGERSEEEDGGSSAASFGSALDDGAADPRAIAAAAVSESARLRKELGMARAEAAAALAMEHGKRTAVAEAHRGAHATTIRQAAQLRDAHEEIASLRRRLSFEASARAELEEQLSVAIEDAKELATEAVSRQRRAVAQATAAEKALFARGELQMLAEAVAARCGGDDGNAYLQQLPPEADAPCRWLLAMGFSRQRCFEALVAAAKTRSALLYSSTEGSTEGSPSRYPAASIVAASLREDIVDCVDQALKILVGSSFSSSASLLPTDLRPLLETKTPVRPVTGGAGTDATDRGMSPSTPLPPWPQTPNSIQSTVASTPTRREDTQPWAGHAIATKHAKYS